jgi:hypothetical protein
MNASCSLQQVMAQGLDDYSHRHHLTPHQWQVCHHVLQCRTEQLGGLQLRCDNCGYEPTIYHACRDRHCPRCQRQATEQWCEKQKASILDVLYHHMVFTLPHLLNDWVEIYPKVIYTLLFETAWTTLSAFAKDPKRLDGQMGCTAVMHTWGQVLLRHVHLHVLAPGGALDKDGNWHPACDAYLFPAKALSKHFRGGFVSRLRERIKAGEMPDIESEADEMLDKLMQKDWVVYSKPVLHATEEVVDYMGRYTHRIALSDSRLHPGILDEIQLDYLDYRDNKRKRMVLENDELIRRFLLHVLPKGFVRVRHYGFLANCCWGKKLPAIREGIERQERKGQTPLAVASTHAEGRVLAKKPDKGEYPCKKCHQGRLKVIDIIAPKREEGG